MSRENTIDLLPTAIDALKRAEALASRKYGDPDEIDALRAVAEIAERVASIQRMRLDIRHAETTTITIPNGLTSDGLHRWLATWLEAHLAANTPIGAG